MLTLTIKKKWFDMILNGEKKEEYREIKRYYIARFSNVFEMADSHSYTPVGNDVHPVMFRNGYHKDSPSFIAMCSLNINTGKTEWGAKKDMEYFVLAIKEIIATH